jgi:hypothetical protein
LRGPDGTFLVSWLGDADAGKCAAGDCAIWGQVWKSKEAVSEPVQIVSPVSKTAPFDVEFVSITGSWLITAWTKPDMIVTNEITASAEVGEAVAVASGSYFMPKADSVVASNFKDIRGLDLIWNPAIEKFLLVLDAQIENGLPIREAYGTPELSSFAFQKVLNENFTAFGRSELTLRSGEYAEGVAGFPSQDGWRIHWRTSGPQGIRILTSAIDGTATSSAPKEVLGPIQDSLAFVGNESEIIQETETGFELALFARTITGGVADLSAEFHRVSLSEDMVAISRPEKVGIKFADYESQLMQRSYTPFIRRLAMATIGPDKLAFFGEYVDYQDGVDRVVTSSRISAWTFGSNEGANWFQVADQTEASAPALLSLDSLLVGTYSVPTSTGSELRIAFFDISAPLNVPTFDSVDSSVFPGETTVISGQNLGEVESITNRDQGRDWGYEIVSRTPSSITVRVPEDASPGIDSDLTAGTPIGEFEVPGSITVLESEPESEEPGLGPTLGAANPQPPAAWQQGPLAFWVKKFDDDEVKFYAKNILYRGKVQLFLNGKEVDWINGTTATDPKLRHVNGMYYRVTGEQLTAGKNTFKAKLNGEWVTFQNGKQYTTYAKK